MRTRFSTQLALAMTLGLLASLALVGGALAAETTLTAQLTGEADTDEDGTGMATVVLDPEAGTACWEMTVENVDPITVSHIHEGAAGVDGGVVVDLDLDGFESSSEGCNEAADADTLQAIIDSPADFYVNVHNEDFPGGAIRGQLAAAAVPSTAVSGPLGTSPLLLIGVALLGLSLVIGVRTLRPAARRG
jgi:hypothetical protein